jgi:hypothetical protein
VIPRVLDPDRECPCVDVVFNTKQCLYQNI